jgi:hypothetical protein
MTLGGRRLRADESKNLRSCIVLWMAGGASQIDTFDLKPGHENGGPFKEIETAVPGIRISEHLPKMAERAKHLAIIRSMCTQEGDHRRASDHLHTGYRQKTNFDYPSLGALVSNERRATKNSLPSFVNIAPPDGLPSDKPGFLGSQYAPLVLRPVEGANGSDDQPDVPPQLRVDNLQPPKGMALARIDSRNGLLQALNDDFSSRQPDAVSQSHRVAYSRAIQLMDPAAARAFDLDEEPAAIREAYGTDIFGQGCLLARRLVERGVGFVEVALGALGNQLDWDTHALNFPQVQQLSRQLDRSWSQLIDDLEARGLLESTLIVWMSEFGRTPKINKSVGRDHFPAAWSTVLAGGCIKGGQAVGRTSADGMTVEDRPIFVPDFISTVCLGLGIDPAKQNISSDGQPIRIVDNSAKPMLELLASR